MITDEVMDSSSDMFVLQLFWIKDAPFPCVSYHHEIQETTYRKCHMIVDVVFHTVEQMGVSSTLSVNLAIEARDMIVHVSCEYFPTGLICVCNWKFILLLKFTA